MKKEANGMATHSIVSRFLVIGPVVATLVAGCASSVGLGIKPKYIEGVETRVAIMSKCPRAGEGSRSESAVPAALAGTLIPPLVDASLDFVDATLRQSAEEHTTTTGASTVGLFYSARPTSIDSGPPFEVQRNAVNGCLVVAYGPMSEDAPSAGFDRLDFSSIEQRTLKDDVGLQGNPHFYYEGRFVYSPDRSAFRIESANIWYAKTLEEGGAGVRNLELSVRFLSPSATAKEKIFAVGTIPIGTVSTGTNLLGVPELGTAAGAKFSSPWMPLPSIDDKMKHLLAEARVAVGNLESTLSHLSTTYATYVDPNAVKAIESEPQTIVKEFIDQLNKERINRALKHIDRKIEMLTEEVVEKSYHLDEAALKLNLKLELEKRGLDRIDALAFERDWRLEAMVARAALSKQRAELESAIEARAAVKTLETATRDLHRIINSVEQKASSARSFGPFTVMVTLTERRDSNAVLKFFAEVFSSAKHNLTSELKASLDPKTRRDLEEKEQQEAEKRQDEFLALRKAAALAVRAVRGAEIERRLLSTTAGEIERHNAETKLHSAVLDATYACQRAARRTAQPTECAPYL